MSNVGWIETSRRANNQARVYWINPQGDLADLIPNGTPPIITGIAKDPQRILVDTGDGMIQDILPDKLGLATQVLINLKQFVFK